MDSAPSRQLPFDTISLSPGISPLAGDGEADSGDDPPSRPQRTARAPGEDRSDPQLMLEPLRFVLGLLIATATLTVPLAAVLLDRSTPLTITTSPDLQHPLSHGSDATVGLTGSRSGEPAGGDSGRQPQ